MALTDIPAEYNVVAVSFMKGAGIPAFKPYKESDEEFRRQVGVLNSQGRAVRLSLGGADGYSEKLGWKVSVLCDGPGRVLRLHCSPVLQPERRWHLGG